MTSEITRGLHRSGNRIGRNVTIAMRAERIIARRRLAVLRSQSGLMAFAALIAGIGVVMLNLGAFFWIADSLGNAAAGCVIALANFVIAALLAMQAARMSVEKELEPVIEVRDLAVEDIEAEVAGVLSEAGELAENVRRIARDPFGATLPSLLAPLLSVLLKSLRK
ncbi:hypothetical protein [Tropicimonas marinistellae]|uniref:hypothetical protein n=1 Tax=Tropicimonas marinistellae TaxID=1739787 RepID=UPI000834E1E5|nr:hypothetical protein [Tropicimonas marinistellae]